jgi:serine/threonine-protein kinase
VPSPAADLTPGDVLGPYRIEEPIGEGGMGQVFRAAHEDGSLVALKVLKGVLLEDHAHARRFAREARAAREIEHRHLVEVLDAGEVGGRGYLAMRYVAGRSLADQIRDRGALPVDEAVRIVAEVASGLDALHRARMVHRDVKPSNILLDEERGAVLTDFGLVKGRDYSALTRPGQLLGTLDYIAPELLRGDEPGPAGDVYALGGVAFECFAGRPPFAGRSGFALGMAHLDEEPPDPCAGREDTAPGLGDVIRLALEKDPAKRPETATAYARMLIVAARSV